jgi:gas vesicle protein
MSKENDKSVVFLTGLLIGGILGTVVAMLYTPVSGKKLRRKISAAKDDFVEDIGEYVETGKEKAEELIKEGKKKAENIFDEAKKKLVSN